MRSIVRIQEPLLSHIKELKFTPINIIDLFPMMKNGLCTTNAVINLVAALDSGIFTEDPNMLSKSSDRRMVPDEIKVKILEEEAITKEILELLKLLVRARSRKELYLMTTLIHLLKSKEDASTCFNLELHKKIINILLEHPQVDPLQIHITQNNIPSTVKFLTHPKSNKIALYKFCGAEINKEVKEIIRKDVILRVFLCKECFLMLPQDIFYYFLKLQIF